LSTAGVPIEGKSTILAVNEPTTGPTTKSSLPEIKLVSVSPGGTNFITKMRKDVQFLRERHDILTIWKVKTYLTKNLLQTCQSLGMIHVQSWEEKNTLM
jgi:hypothetical protein